VKRALKDRTDMRIIKTNMSEESTEGWRTYLKDTMPENVHKDIDMGICDYLFSCTYVDEEDIYRAIKETYERS